MILKHLKTLPIERGNKDFKTSRRFPIERSNKDFMVMSAKIEAALFHYQIINMALNQSEVNLNFAIIFNKKYYQNQSFDWFLRWTVGAQKYFVFLDIHIRL